MGSFRPAKMGSVIRQIVSEAISHKLNDPRISPFASITRVEVSGDLQIAKVYVSVMGDPGQERRTLRGLQHASGHLQRLLAKQLVARHCPEIRFIADESVKGSIETVRLIDQSMREVREREEGEPENSDPDELDDDGAGV